MANVENETKMLQLESAISTGDVKKVVKVLRANKYRVFPSSVCSIGVVVNVCRSRMYPAAEILRKLAGTDRTELVDAIIDSVDYSGDHSAVAFVKKLGIIRNVTQDAVINMNMTMIRFLHRKMTDHCNTIIGPRDRHLPIAILSTAIYTGYTDGVRYALRKRVPLYTGYDDNWLYKIGINRISLIESHVDIAKLLIRAYTRQNIIVDIDQHFLINMFQKSYGSWEIDRNLSLHLMILELIISSKCVNIQLDKSFGKSIYYMMNDLHVGAVRNHMVTWAKECVRIADRYDLVDFRHLSLDDIAITNVGMYDIIVGVGFRPKRRNVLDTLASVSSVSLAAKKMLDSGVRKPHKEDISLLPESCREFLQNYERPIWTHENHRKITRGRERNRIRMLMNIWVCQEGNTPFTMLPRELIWVIFFFMIR